jgi:two-component system, NtrC family, response regulator HydG
MSDASLSLVGITPVALALKDQIDCAARSDAKVLITGESGTGKDVAARLIHARSRRRGYLLTTINCAGIPDSLLESELFGFRRGSFTGALRDRAGLLEKAHKGTLFMDEVAEMSLRMQGTMLRFLETGEVQPIGSEKTGHRVDVRVLTATNCNLDDHVTSRAFRLDLFYRLNVIHLHLPPLRQHSGDVAPLLNHFIDMYSQRYQTPPREVPAATLECLTRYTWPGNIRQLKNVAERLIVSGGVGPISVDELPSEIKGSGSDEPRRPEATLEWPGRAEKLLERMLVGGESFWSAVYGPFMTRDLTRDEVRFIVGRGLQKTHGSYLGLMRAFNMTSDDHKRFLHFLRKHECELSRPIRASSVEALPEPQLHDASVPNAPVVDK